MGTKEVRSLVISVLFVSLIQPCFAGNRGKPGVGTGKPGSGKPVDASVKSQIAAKKAANVIQKNNSRQGDVSTKNLDGATRDVIKLDEARRKQDGGAAKDQPVVRQNEALVHAGDAAQNPQGSPAVIKMFDDGSGGQRPVANSEQATRVFDNAKRDLSQALKDAQKKTASSTSRRGKGRRSYGGTTAKKRNAQRVAKLQEMDKLMTRVEDVIASLRAELDLHKDNANARAVIEGIISRLKAGMGESVQKVIAGESDSALKMAEAVNKLEEVTNKEFDQPAFDKLLSKDGKKLTGEARKKAKKALFNRLLAARLANFIGDPHSASSKSFNEDNGGDFAGSLTKMVESTGALLTKMKAAQADVNFVRMELALLRALAADDLEAIKKAKEEYSKQIKEIARKLKISEEEARKMVCECRGKTTQCAA